MSYSPVTRTAGTPSGAPGRGQSAGVLGGLGRACYRHRWLTLLTWIVGVVCLITLWLVRRPGAEQLHRSDPGQTVLNQHFPRQSGDKLTLAIRSAGAIGSPAVRAQVDGALAPFARAPQSRR